MDESAEKSRNTRTRNFNDGRLAFYFAMEQRSAFIDELRMCAKRRGLILEEVFRDYDRKELGVVSYRDFRNVLSQCGFWADESRIQRAVQDFINVEKRTFNYVDFLHSTSATSSPRKAANDDFADFAQMIKERNLHVEDIVEPYDVHHIGRVSIANFMRAFGNSPLIVRICNAYKIPATNEVDYVQLSQEVRKFRGMKSQAKLVVEQPLTELPPSFTQIAIAIKDQATDYRSSFVQLDKFKRGRVTRTQFALELRKYNLKVTSKELEEIIDLFQDERGDIDYVMFCSAVDSAVKNAPQIERSTFSTQGNIEKTLEFLRQCARHRHMQLLDVVREMDPRSTGVIASGRFFRGLAAQEFRLTQPDIRVLELEYGDGNGNIEYERLLNDVMPQSRQGTQVSAILDRLADSLKTRRLLLKPMLQKYYDYDRNGMVAASDLISALRKISFDMNPREHQALLNYLGTSRDARVSIDEFCARVDPVIPVTVPVEEPKPTTPVREVRPEPPQDVTDALVKMVASERKNDIDFDNEFRARDSLRRGVVPTSQFASVILAPQSLCTQNDLNALVEYYKASPHQVMYSGLIKDMREFAVPVEEELNTTEKALAATRSTHKDTMDIIMRLKNFCDEQRITPVDMFVRYDAMRNGLVMSNRLRGIFDAIGFRISPVDEERLKKDFQDTRLPEMFDYRQLCIVVDQTKLTIADLAQIRTATEPVPVQDKELVSLLTSLRERIYQRRKRVHEPFSEFKPGEAISEQEFRKALGYFGLLLREFEIQILLRNYRVNKQRFIDWERFCQDVEASKTVQGAY